MLRLSEGANLTIKDSGTGGAVESTFFCIISDGVLTVESGTIKGDGGINNNGTLYINGGTVQGTIYSAITNSATVYINGGMLKSEKEAGVFNCPDSTLYVYAGEIDGIINQGAAYISGGDIHSDDYIALNLLAGTVEITGGSFTGTKIMQGSNGDTLYGENTVYYTEGATLILKGGEFPGGFVADGATANSFLADGYAFYDADGNKITVADDAKKIDGFVQVKEHFIASVTEKDGSEVGRYKTIGEAVDALTRGDDRTVILLDDIHLTGGFGFRGGKLTLDLNGKTLSSQKFYVLYIESGADVTIKDSGTGGTIERISSGGTAIHNDGVLTFESGTVKGDGGIGNSQSGVLNFRNGTIEAVTYGAINNFGTAYIYGGVLKSEKFAALVLNKGTMEITDGSFTGTDDEHGTNSGTPYGEWTVDYTEGATLILKGGEFPGGFVADTATANSFLADGCFFKNADGRVITVADDAKRIDGFVKVSKGADLADAVITIDQTQFTYTGDEIEPAVTVTVGGKQLEEGIDYTVEYANNINAGTAAVTVTGTGIYEGETAKDFSIAQREVTVAGAQVLSTKVYDGLTYAQITNYGTLKNTADGDDIEIDTANIKAFYADKSVGYEKQVTFAGYALKGEDAANYVLVSQPEPTMASISKKSVTVSATVPDMVYGDDYHVDQSKAVITFDGVLGGDDVGYVVTDAWYHASVAMDNAPVHIVYNVTGADAGNYKFPEYGDWIAPDYPVEAVGRILPRDIAEAEITLGDALVYNGKEQTQTVASVTFIGKDATCTVSGNTATNVGVYELTITGNGNFTGTKTVTFEIAPDTSGINDITVDNVKATDKAAVEALAEQLKNAVTDLADEETKAGYAALADKCEELANKIAETEEKLEEIQDLKNGYSPEAVTSDDKAAIENIVAQLEEINPDNLTEEQKTEYAEIKADYDALLAEIEAAVAAVDAVGAELEIFDEERVTIFWADEIEALKAKVDELLADVNMGEAEKAKLNEYKAQCDKLIEIINTPEEYLSKRIFYLIVDAFDWFAEHMVFVFDKIF